MKRSFYWVGILIFGFVSSFFISSSWAVPDGDAESKANWEKIHAFLDDANQEKIRRLKKKWSSSVSDYGQFLDTNPAQAAAKNANPYILRLIAKEKLDLLTERDGCGITPLHLAVCSRKPHVIETVQLLVELAPETLRLKHIHGFTPLREAINCRAVPVIEILASTTPDLLEEVDLDGETLAHRAIESEHYDVVKSIYYANPMSIFTHNRNGITVYEILKSRALQGLMDSDAIEILRSLQIKKIL